VGETRNDCKIFTGNSEKKRPFRIPRRRWGDNIKIDLKVTRSLRV
jgi:hypothetical protein